MIRWICDWCGEESEALPNPNRDTKAFTRPKDWHPKSQDILCVACHAALTAAVGAALQARRLLKWGKP